MSLKEGGIIPSGTVVCDQSISPFNLVSFGLLSVDKTVTQIFVIWCSLMNPWKIFIGFPRPQWIKNLPEHWQTQV